MCSIFGAIGTNGEDFSTTSTREGAMFHQIRANAGDRGRDGGRFEVYTGPDGLRMALGNWRATPTPELAVAPLQPYDRLVHNGTIANDRELGAQDGEVDSMVLPRVLRCRSLFDFAVSLSAVKGSYALAWATQKTILAAVNYKPLHYWKEDGGPLFFSSMYRHFVGVTPRGQAPVELTPYTAIDFLTLDTQPLARTSEDRVVVIASAGLDSTVVATEYVRQGFDVCLLHVDYGCRAGRAERSQIPRIAERLQCDYEILSIPYSRLAGTSPLLDLSAEIAGGVAGAEYAHEWVPARNLVLTSIAAAYAEAHGYHLIALGNNLEEAGAYPDNEEQMTILLDRVLANAVQEGYELRMKAPVGHLMKHEIVAMGVRNGAPFDETFSCYREGPQHCGECGPCFMRRTAFERNGLQDPVFAIQGASR